MRYLYLISVILFIFSCHHETELPDVYEVIFHNRYFESIILIEVADNKIEDINIGDKIAISGIPSGKQQIIVTTQSGLIIEAIISLTGSNPRVNIALKENGKLYIE